MSKISNHRHAANYRMPAEWEPQSGVQLTWPHDGTDWLPYLDDITKTFKELALSIAKYEKVLIVAPHIGEIKATLNHENIRFFECETNDTWARDHAAITLINGKGDAELLDFCFNGWGNKFPSEHDNHITRKLFDNGMLHGNLQDHNDFVLEGGSIESDGNGTIFTTSHCLLAQHRNQPLTKEQIEQELMARLNAQRIVWLDYGLLIGDDTDGHIDTIVRIAPNDTLLYIACDDTSDPQYEDFKELEKQLKTLKTASGEPYNLLKLPMTDGIYDGKERLPATYANFLVINEAVVCPTYNQPEKDRKALEVISKAYPERDIIPIDARTIVRQHGSIHCLTMQYPQGVIQ